MKEKKITLDLFHRFTPDELNEKAQFLASEIIQCSELEAEKKKVADSFKERIEAKEAMIWFTSAQVRQ